jgi:hypothetical protein
MTDDLENELELLLRPAAPAGLRGRVLSAVAQELTARKRRVPLWERAAEIAVAASLLLGVGMNLWQWRENQAWHQRVFGPSSAASDCADHGGAMQDSDPQLAQLQRQRVVSRPTSWERWQRRGQWQTQLALEIAAQPGG